jgi:quinol monooxygenase YgiN
MRLFTSLMAMAATTLATSVAVTEIANITLIANSSTDVFNEVAKVVLQQPGAVTFRSSRLVENKDSFRLFVDWESVEASRKFAKTKAYKKLVAKVKPIVASKPAIYNVKFTPSPPVVLDNEEGKGESPFTEFLNFFFPAGPEYTEERMANVTETTIALVEENAPTAPGFTGHTATGWSLDQVMYMGALRRVFVLTVGWETVEAHKAWMVTPAYQKFLPQLQGLDGLLGIEMRHVSNKVVRKSA